MLKLAVISSLAVLAAVTAAQAVVNLGDQRLAQAQAAPVIAAAVQTPAPPAPSGGQASIAKSPDGHFWAEARVNNHDVKFLVDTGATAVALSPDDARRLGISMGSLNYTYKVTTAHGPARAARINLDTVSVNGARVDDVDAYVIENGLDTSLLGMSYLGRLNRFEATRSALILTP